MQPEEVRSGLKALWAEDFIASDPSRARAKILMARELLRDLGEESAA